MLELKSYPSWENQVQNILYVRSAQCDDRDQMVNHISLQLYIDQTLVKE